MTAGIRSPEQLLTGLTAVPLYDGEACAMRRYIVLHDALLAEHEAKTTAYWAYIARWTGKITPRTQRLYRDAYEDAYWWAERLRRGENNDDGTH